MLENNMTSAFISDGDRVLVPTSNFAVEITAVDKLDVQLSSVVLNRTKNSVVALDWRVFTYGGDLCNAFVSHDSFHFRK